MTSTLLSQWIKDCTLAARLHTHASLNYQTWARVAGFPLAILTTFTGSGTFATYNSSNVEVVRLIFGALLLLTAALHVLNQYFDLPTMAAEHRKAAVAYEKLVRNMELMLTSNDFNQLQSVLDQINSISSCSPVIEPRISRSYVNEIDVLARSMMNDVPNVSENVKELRQIHVVVVDDQKEQPQQQSGQQQQLHNVVQPIHQELRLRVNKWFST